MVHLQKRRPPFVEKLPTKANDPPACAAGLPGVEEAFAFPLSGFLWVFSFSKASVSPTEATIFAEFCFISGEKRNLESKIRVHGHEICQLSKNVLICRCVFLKLFIV